VIASTPDIILFNATIATQSRQQPIAKAVAIGQGRILAVGSSDNALRLAGPGTEVIDLAGRLVVPGFIDTHIHFYEWALKRQGVKLDDLTSLDDLVSRVHRVAENQPAGRWIMGQGWNETDWIEPHMPTRIELDRAAPNHPVLLWRCDLHLAAANSAALKLAGIDAGTPDPPEGRIEHDLTGQPTGILRELAINRVREAIAPPDEGQVLTAFEDAARALHRRGVTGIHDVRLMADKDGADALRTFQRLDREDRLDLRSWVTLPGDRLEDIIGLGLQTGFGNDCLRIGHVKFFSDGGMGARTAWMIDPYLDAGAGMPLMDMAVLAEDIRKADAAGLSTMVHAVGDRANRELIDIFEDLESRRTQAGNPRPRIPHRIEHVQMIRPEDAGRLRNLGLALCLTPANLILDINLIDSAVGEKGRWTYAFRRLMDTGAPVMFSSDCPVCDPDPLAGIHAAVTRQRGDGTPSAGWHPQNRISAAEALRAYTVTPARVHQAPDLGVIAPGKMADLAVLSENILTSHPSRIPGAHVDMTVFDGRIVYRTF
jgi:predicted amidohydrolase YtcJ